MWKIYRQWARQSSLHKTDSNRTNKRLWWVQSIENRWKLKQITTTMRVTTPLNHIFLKRLDPISPNVKNNYVRIDALKIWCSKIDRNLSENYEILFAGRSHFSEESLDCSTHFIHTHSFVLAHRQSGSINADEQIEFAARTFILRYNTIII